MCRFKNSEAEAPSCSIFIPRAQARGFYPFGATEVGPCSNLQDLVCRFKNSEAEAPSCSIFFPRAQARGFYPFGTTEVGPCYEPFGTDATRATSKPPGLKPRPAQSFFPGSSPGPFGTTEVAPFQTYALTSSGSGFWAACGCFSSR